MNTFKLFFTIYFLVILTLVIVWFLLYPPLQLGGDTGYFVIATTSMMPTLYPGDLVLTKPAKVYHVGDIIAYVSPEHIVVVHRIIEALGNGCYRTKGDANPRPDPWIVCRNMIIGKVVLRIPLLGSLIEEARKSPIVMATVIIIASLIIISPIAIAYSLANRRNNEATIRSISEKYYGTSKKDDKVLLIIGIVLSSVCILIIASLVYTALSFKYVTKTIRKPIVTIIDGAYYVVLLKNNTLYNTTILRNPSYTYVKIVRNIIINPYIRILYDDENIRGVWKKCTLSVVIVQERTYGWNKTILENISCVKPIIISYRSLKELIDNISREVNMYSTVYSIELIYNIHVKYMLKSGIVKEKTLHKVCKIELNYIFNVISFKKCFSKDIIYNNVTKLILRKIRTPFGYLNIENFAALMMSLLTVPITSMSLIVYFYSKKRKKRNDILEEIFNRYGHIIIRTSEKPRVSGKEVIRVVNFEDLVKLSKIVSKPIFYVMFDTDRGRVHLFYVESNGKLFVYMLISHEYISQAYAR